MNINITKFQRVVETAKAAAADSPRWVAAIEKAAEAIIANPYIAEEKDGLLILSDSGVIYHANGACQCQAYSFGKPCWHRAAAKLVKRYNEETAPVAVSPARIERRIETDRSGQRFTVVRCNGWCV